MYPYDNVTSHFSFDAKQVAATSKWSHYEVTFPVAFKTKYEQCNTAFGDYFVPAKMVQVPLAILVPGAGEGSLVPCLMLARHLVRQGIAALVLHLMFHPPRMSELLTSKHLPGTPDFWLEVFKVSVSEVRSVVVWAANRQEIDSGNISVVGVSLGGMVSVITMAADRRIAKGVFIVTGGNLAEMSWGGKSEEARSGHSCTRQECLNAYSHYPRYLEEVAQKGVANVTPAKECFLFDPLTFAGLMKERSILMINAENDEVVSRRSTQELWEACDRPPLIWLPGNHFGISSQVPRIGSEVIKFLGSPEP